MSPHAEGRRLWESWQSIRSAIVLASLFAFGVAANGVSLAPARAETVDVTKESWWLTPYKASKPWTIGRVLHGHLNFLYRGAAKGSSG